MNGLTIKSRGDESGNSVRRKRIKGSTTKANLSLLTVFRGEDVLIRKKEGILDNRYLHIIKINDISH